MSDTLNAPAPANSPEARTATGELKDQTKPLIPSTPTDTQQTQADSKETTQPETKPETKTDDKKLDGKKETLLSDDKAELTGAPEKYEDFTAPEGHELNPEIIGEFLPLAKELNLSQAGAQRLIDFYGKAMGEAADAPYKAFDAMTGEWRAQAIADKEIGDGTKVRPEVKATIGKAKALLGDVSGFNEAMNLTGVGDHPAFIKAFYKLAKLVTEGKHVLGSGPSAEGQKSPGAKPASAASALYPNLPSSSRG